MNILYILKREYVWSSNQHGSAVEKKSWNAKYNLSPFCTQAGSPVTVGPAERSHHLRWELGK